MLGTTTYTYGNDAWGDLLTNYNGTNISYDEIGNPLNWHNVTSMTWTQGRRLTAYTYTENGKTYNVSLAYNSEGIRIQKIAVNANDSSDMKIHVYTVDGSVIIREYVYTLSQGIGSSSTLYYIYDASGDCIGFKDGNRETYLFGKNAQGDVVALFNSATEVVARYYYDAWGNIISITDALGNEITNANHIALLNPIRYRSYHYESDTGFYYLNSRYYDPQVGRFINADILIDQRTAVGYNLFIYCWNNPINKLDKTGALPYNCEIKPSNVCDEEILNEIRNADFSVPIYSFVSKHEDGKYNVYEFSSGIETKTRYILFFIPWGDYTEYTTVEYYFERVNKAELSKKMDRLEFLQPIILFMNDFSNCGTTGSTLWDACQAIVGLIPALYYHKKDKIEYEIRCTEVLRFAKITVVVDGYFVNTYKEYV